MKKKKSPEIAFLLTFVLPGLGHFYIKKYKHCFLIFLILIGFFIGGLLLKGSLSVKDEEIWFIKIIFNLCLLSNGFLYIISKILGFGKGDLYYFYYEIGQNLLYIAGLLNILAMFNAHDLAYYQEEK